MNIRKLATGLLLTAVLAVTGCWKHCDHDQRDAKCCPPPSPCCPQPGGAAVVPSGAIGPPTSGAQYYYGPPR